MQVQVREAGVHIEGGAVGYGLEVRTGLAILPGEGVEVAESQERLELQLHLGRGVQELILDEELVFVRAQGDLLAEDDLTDLVGDGGNRVCVEVHDVLVPAGLIDVSVAVDAQVEPLAAQGDAFVQGTQQDVPESVELLHRNGQQAMVAPRITRHDGRVAVRAGLVRQDNLALQGILEIDEFRLVEFQKSHKYVFILASKLWHTGPADTP